MGLEAFSRIEVPIPRFEEQLEFDHVRAKMDETTALRIEADRELNALMSSVLSKALSGEF